MEKKLGVEIEFTGVRRIDVVRVLENFFHTIAEEVVSETTEDKYKFHRLTDSNGGRGIKCIIQRLKKLM